MSQLIKLCMCNGKQYGLKFVNRRLHAFNWHQTILARSKFTVSPTCFQLTTRKYSNSTSYTDMESSLFLQKVEQGLLIPSPGLKSFITEGKKYSDLLENTEFQHQINSILENTKCMTSDNIVCTLNSLTMLQIPLYHQVVKQALDEILTRLKNGEQIIL